MISLITNIPQVLKLLSEGSNLLACETFRTNKRFYPKSLIQFDNNYKQGDNMENVQSDDVSVTRWKSRSKLATLIVVCIMQESLII